MSVCLHVCEDTRHEIDLDCWSTVLHSAAFGGSVVLWAPSGHFGSFTAANWVSFDFNVFYSAPLTEVTP